MNKENIYNFLINHDITIEKDLFNYGFHVLMTYLKYLLVIIPFSILLKTQFEVLCFLVLFVPLRRYVGGFHLKSSSSCFFWSVILAIIIPYLSSRFNNFNYLSTLLVFVICFFMTKKLGVIDHPNKAISEKEKIIYLKKALLIETLYCGIAIVFRNTNLFFVSNLVNYILIFFICGMLVNFFDKNGEK